jgi:hypothetical protein
LYIISLSVNFAQQYELIIFFDFGCLCGGGGGGGGDNSNNKLIIIIIIIIIINDATISQKMYVNQLRFG